MTFFQIQEALADIVGAKYHDCEQKLHSLPSDAISERNALKLQNGLYSLCTRAGLLYHVLVVSKNEKQWETRKKVTLKIMTQFPKLQAAFERADEYEREVLLAVTHSDVYMRDQFLRRYEEDLAAAITANDVENAFELRIKVGAIREVLQGWEAWRVKNNLYPHLFDAD